MQTLFKNIKEDFKKYNIVSKYIIKIGTPLLLSLILCVIICKIEIASGAAPDSLVILFEDLLECIKESFGAIYFTAFFLEILHIYSFKK